MKDRLLASSLVLLLVASGCSTVKRVRLVTIPDGARARIALENGSWMRTAAQQEPCHDVGTMAGTLPVGCPFAQEEDLFVKLRFIKPGYLVEERVYRCDSLPERLTLQLAPAQ